MVTTNAPFGMRPIWHPSGLGRSIMLTGAIPTAYATAIYKYQPVKYATSGEIQPAAATDTFCGVFMGVQYIDTTGRPQYAPNWTASTALMSGTTAQAWYTRDPAIIYEIQADGSLAQTAIGDEADFTNATANNGLGFSQATISTTLAGAGVTAQLQILDLALWPNNAWADTYTVMQVRINKHQFNASVVAI